MSLAVDHKDGDTILRDEAGRQVLRLQQDGGLVVNSGMHPLDARALGPVGEGAELAIHAWAERARPQQRFLNRPESPTTGEKEAGG